MNCVLTKATAILLLLSFLLSFGLPLSAADHCCTEDDCAICLAIETGLRLLLFAIVYVLISLPCHRAAARAFMRARAKGLLFYTPVALKVKLSD